MFHFRRAEGAPTKPVLQLPSSSPLASAVLLALESPDLTPEQIVAILSKDQTLASITMKLACGREGPEVRSLIEAVALVWPDTLNQSSSTTAVWRRLGDNAERSLMRGIWKHSLATAIISSQLAGETVPGGPAYTLGLLHSLGQIAMVHSNPHKYDSAMERAKASLTSLRSAELMFFGFDSHEACSTILASWNLHQMRNEYESSTTLEQACIAAHSFGFGGCMAHPDCIPPKTVSIKTAHILRHERTAEVVNGQINTLERLLAGKGEI